ncbi:hypothetical protein MKX03_025239 [Papaver bracteatum]|nr:hypothetical protein MKX03_025239 [Papaver bracteatum]
MIKSFWLLGFWASIKTPRRREIKTIIKWLANSLNFSVQVGKDSGVFLAATKTN